MKVGQEYETGGCIEVGWPLLQYIHKPLEFMRAGDLDITISNNWCAYITICNSAVLII